MKHYIGVDVGGTKIEGVLVNRQLRILKHLRVPTDADQSREKIVEKIAALINVLKGRHVCGIGIGVPGFVDSKGRMQITPNIPQFTNFNLKKALEGKLRHKVIVENDANCFVIAEQHAGIAKKMQNVIGITLGTGVGGGAFLAGRLFHGKNGGAAHFGQMIINHEKDVEWWCGGRSMEKRYLLATGKDRKAKDILTAKGPAARRMAESFYHMLGVAISNLINAFNPEIIVLGGSISDSTDLRQLRAEVYSHGQPSLTKETKIVKHKLGPSAGMLGAAILNMR